MKEKQEKQKEKASPLFAAHMPRQKKMHPQSRQIGFYTMKCDLIFCQLIGTNTL